MPEKNENESVVAIAHDVTNEMIVIAACLVDENLRNEHVPKEPIDRFIASDHAIIWAAMKKVVQRKKGFDLQQLHAEVKGKIRLQYLKSLVDSYPDPPVSMGVHISALHWDSVRARATVESIPDFLTSLKDNTQPPAQVQAAAERVARSLSVKLDQTFMADPIVLAGLQREEIRKRKDMHNGCYEYGIKELDYFEDGTHRCIPGAAPGKITNITACSGAGKSVLAAYFALQIARQGRGVLCGAWEMGAGETLEMMTNISLQTMPISGLTGSRYDTSTGALGEDALDSFEERMLKIGQAIRFFDPPFADDPDRDYDNTEALAELHRMVVDSGCEVIVYDLFERCLPDGAPGPERRALFGLQALHKKTDTHGLIVTQQKIKEIESRPDKRPTRSTILGSQAWVDISDTIIGVHREALWKPIPDTEIELLILKQRFGKWPMAIQFEWDGEHMTIANGVDVDFEHPGKKESVFEMS